MRRSLLVTLLAATAMLPSAAMARQDVSAEQVVDAPRGAAAQAPTLVAAAVQSDRGGFRQRVGGEGDNGGRGNGGRFNGDGQRFDRAPQVQQGQPAQQPQFQRRERPAFVQSQQQVQQPQAAPVQQREFRQDRRQDRQAFRQDRGQDQQGFRRDRQQDRQAFQNGGVTAPAFRQERRDDRQDFNRDRRDDRQDFRRERRDDRQDLRQQGQRFNQNVQGQNAFRGQAYGGTQYRGQGYGNRNRANDYRGREFNNRGNWNRNWRQNQQFNWQGFRGYNRNAFHLPRYYAPYGYNYGYQRFGIGFTLSSILFDQSYWIDDPEFYRLPPAYGPYEWVRYYNDALLVDIRTGYVVDTVYDIFW